MVTHNSKSDWPLPIFLFFSEMDTAYRILADHIRMITVCLTDHLLPDVEPKLRQVLRRALRIQKDQFGVDDPVSSAEMTYQLADVVLGTLQYHYPTPNLKKDLINSVLHYEVEHMLSQEKINDKAMKKLVKMVHF